MKTFLQLCREFWVPLLVSVAWVMYSVLSSSPHDWDIPKVVNSFGPTFFLVSWLVGQIFRVRKQTRVEENFSGVERRLITLLTELESRTKDTIDHVTGGDSFAYLAISSPNSITNEGVLMAVHQGKHPLYDVVARIVDLNQMASFRETGSGDHRALMGTTVEIGNLIPSHATMVRQWTIGHANAQDYNIFLTARNGSFTQQLRLRRVDGEWMSATRVVDPRHLSGMGEKLLHEQADTSFPRGPDGLVQWK